MCDAISEMQKALGQARHPQLAHEVHAAHGVRAAHGECAASTRYVSLAGVLPLGMCDVRRDLCVAVPASRSWRVGRTRRVASTRYVSLAGVLPV